MKEPTAAQSQSSSEEQLAQKRASRISQTSVPICSVKEALKVPQAIWDNYAGKPATPIQVCQALDLSPSSSKWRDLAGSSIAYGFTTGGYNAKEVVIESLGKRAVAPTVEEDDIAAIQQAAKNPAILKRFFAFYDNKKLPKDSIAENMLIEWGVPKDRAKSVLRLIKENGEFAHLFSDIKGNIYIIKGTNESNSSITQSVDDSEDERDKEENEIPEALLNRLRIEVPEKAPVETVRSEVSRNNKVFVSHGKNREMVENLKELLKFGGFDPVISVERETTAISVPEKVFNDMRSCCAGIIHIQEERIVLGENNIPQRLLNENVLIEIGAAIALYGNRIILLCKKGIELPSNLQGLYRCEYEGDKLDYDSTMKLLRTFNNFK